MRCVSTRVTKKESVNERLVKFQRARPSASPGTPSRPTAGRTAAFSDHESEDEVLGVTRER